MILEIKPLSRITLFKFLILHLIVIFLTVCIIDYPSAQNAILDV